VPEAPPMKPLLFKKAAESTNESKKKPIPEAPPIKSLMLKKAVEIAKESMKTKTPPAPPLNYKSLRTVKDKVDTHYKSIKESKEIMNQQKIEELKERIEADQEQRELAESNISIENLTPFKPNSDFNSPFENEEALNDDEDFAPQTFGSSQQDLSEPQSVKKLYKIKSREKIRKVSQEAVDEAKLADSINQRLEPVSEYHLYSPKFSNEDNELNQRDQPFESSKINKILISNIEALEKELIKSNNRIKHLEEFNNQLINSKNEAYQEKEDLITRSIEYEFFKHRLEEREKRITQLETENSSYIMEIKHLRTDNDDLRQQMENMVQAITKYASTRANGEENGAEIGNTIQQIQQNIRVKSNSKTKNGYEAMKQEEKRKKISTSGKKSKVSKSKKKTKFIRIPNQHSPLSKDQMKLLHDPTSFERYVKELDVSEIKLLDSSGKNNEK